MTSSGVTSPRGLIPQALATCAVLLVASSLVPLFHLDIISDPPGPQREPDAFEARMAGCHPSLRPAFVAYLERNLGTCRPKAVSSMATRLAPFARFPGLNWTNPLGKPSA